MGERIAPSSGPFRINAMSEITGVPRPTLRAWERRYGIPTPLRTASGYRLYDAREIEQVREMRRLCDGGMAASEAARLVSMANVAARGDTFVDVDPYAASERAIVDAVDRFDVIALDLHVRRLMFLGTAPAILDRVVVPALREIGARWHEGKMSIAQEHLATERLGAMLRDLTRLSPGAEGDLLVVLASFADDAHELGLLDAATRLSVGGLRPVVLGARTPPSAVRSAVDALSPSLVGLSVTIAPSDAHARALVDEYAAACGDVPWIVGGAASPALAPLIRARGGMIARGPGAPDDAVDLRELARSILEAAASVSAAGAKSGRRRA